MTFNELSAFAGRAVAVGLAAGLAFLGLLCLWNPGDFAARLREPLAEPDWTLLPLAALTIGGAFVALVRQLWQHFSKEDDWQRWREESAPRTRSPKQH